MSYSGKMQKSHLYSVYFAPRGRDRIYDLGMQIAQLHLSPFDQIIGIIGEPGSGKSMLVKGMFPGLELSNDDNGVNVRPLPLLEQDSENNSSRSSSASFAAKTSSSGMLPSLRVNPNCCAVMRLRSSSHSRATKRPMLSVSLSISLEGGSFAPFTHLLI